MERALRDLKGLPDAVTTKRLELDVQLALVPVLMAVGFADQRTAKAGERALALCDELGVTDQISPLLSQFSYCTSSGQLRRALEIAHRVLALGERSGDILPQMVGH